MKLSLFGGNTLEREERCQLTYNESKGWVERGWKRNGGGGLGSASGLGQAGWGRRSTPALLGSQSQGRRVTDRRGLIFSGSLIRLQIQRKASCSAGHRWEEQL